jgi:hypothetical protein
MACRLHAGLPKAHSPSSVVLHGKVIETTDEGCEKLIADPSTADKIQGVAGVVIHYENDHGDKHDKVTDADGYFDVSGEPNGGDYVFKLVQVQAGANHKFHEQGTASRRGLFSGRVVRVSRYPLCLVPLFIARTPPASSTAPPRQRDPFRLYLVEPGWQDIAGSVA